MTTYSKIIIPTRPQPDSIAAIFILKKFGKEKFPGIEAATVEIHAELPKGETAKTFLDKGFVCIDFSGALFDHHTASSATTVTDLVCSYLGISTNPALKKIREYVRRDDMQGKGTLSSDPLDRAFGLSGLITVLNKTLPNPADAVGIVEPLFEAHFQEEHKRMFELPEEFSQKMKEGKVVVLNIDQRGKKLKAVVLDSDNASMPGYLRSQLGGAFDVVCQITSGGHTNIMTRPANRVDLRSLVVLVRLQEAEKRGQELQGEPKDLAQGGRVEAVPEWYYDMVTNSILNGGLQPGSVTATGLKKDDLVKIMELGLSEKLWKPEDGESASQNISDITFHKDVSTLLLDVRVDKSALAGLEKRAAQEGLFQKNEFHVTLIGFGSGKIILKKLESLPLEARQSALKDIENLSHQFNWAFTLRPEYYLVSKEYHDVVDKSMSEERKSYIQIVDLPDLQPFYKKLNDMLGLYLTVPFAHITLFTTSTLEKNKLQGIGILSEKQFKELNPVRI